MSYMMQLDNVEPGTFLRVWFLSRIDIVLLARSPVIDEMLAGIGTQSQIIQVANQGSPCSLWIQVQSWSSLGGQECAELLHLWHIESNQLCKPGDEALFYSGAEGLWSFTLL